MGQKRPVRMNLPFFAVEAYLQGEVQNQAEKFRKMSSLSSGNEVRKCPEFFATSFVPFFTRQVTASKTKFHGVSHSADTCR